MSTMSSGTGWVELIGGTGGPSDQVVIKLKHQSAHLSVNLNGVEYQLDQQSGGGGASANVGSVTLDFGAFPGKSDASVQVTGQGSIGSGSKVAAWLSPADTSDHSADEHMVESIRILAGSIEAGVGFTVYGINDSEKNEPIDPRSGGGGTGTRLYGTWNVNWQWS